VKLTRRHFLTSTLAGGALTAAGCATNGVGSELPVETATRRALSPNEQLGIASIGCGGQGAADLRAVSDERIIALCDVDSNRAEGAFRAHPDVPKYTDYREMLEKHYHDIDAVTVSTPDHMHGPIALAAMELGMHVYVQKPMARTVAETRWLRDAARRYGVITQMGNQGHSLPGCWMLREMVQSGFAGEITEVHAWTNRPNWPQGVDRPKDTPETPASLDWERWLGVAPHRPYHPGYHPSRWRGWWDFGTGAMGDMGCHVLDPAFTALDLGLPTRAWAEHTGVNRETLPKSSIITMEFPARNGMPPVTLKWHDGDEKPPLPEGVDSFGELGSEPSGTLYYGSKGVLYAGEYGGFQKDINPERQAEWEANAPERMRA
jgi:predicted dehydrogenase